MSCKKYEDKLHSFAIGSLKEAERLELEMHLESCVSCKQEVYDIKRTADFIKANRTVPILPIEMKQNIMASIDLKRYKSADRKNRFELKNWGASMIAAGLILFALNLSHYTNYYLAKESYLYNIGNEIGKKILLPINNLGQSANTVFGKIIELNGITMRMEESKKGGIQNEL